MTQAIEWTLVLGLVGLVWVMVLAILDDKHHRHDKRQGSPSSESHDGAVPQEGSQDSAAVAGSDCLHRAGDDHFETFARV